MVITSIHRMDNLFTIFAVIEGESFEFASFRKGAFEVYHYAKRKSAPVFCGWLSETHARMLRRIVWDKERAGKAA